MKVRFNDLDAFITEVIAVSEELVDDGENGPLILRCMIENESDDNCSIAMLYCSFVCEDDFVCELELDCGFDVNTNYREGTSRANGVIQKLKDSFKDHNVSVRSGRFEEA